MKPSRLPLGLLVRKRRIQLDLTQVALAKRVGVSHPTISQYERNKDYPGGFRLIALGDALRLPGRLAAAPKEASGERGPEIPRDPLKATNFMLRGLPPGMRVDRVTRS